MKVFGVTGGTGAGKSTVIDVWKKFGARILNCDDIYHRLLQTDALLIGELERSFPGMVSGGILDRRKLGQLVFSDSAKLGRLNGISHKYVLAKVREEISAARREDIDVTVIEALYLLETDLAGMCDITVGVIAPANKRVKRIIDRDGLDESYAWLRLRSQMDDDYFFQNCDIIIENKGTLEELIEKARDVYLNNR